MRISRSDRRSTLSGPGRYVVFDTSFLVDYLNGQDYTIDALESFDDVDFVVPSIVLYELYAGAIRSDAKDDSPEAIDRALEWATIEPFGEYHALIAARIQNELRSNGNMIQHRDIMIAAVAESPLAILLTADSHFDNIENERIVVRNPREE